MGIQLDEALKMIAEQDEKIDEMTKMIVALSEEVETKDFLEKKLNELTVKQTMK